MSESAPSSPNLLFEAPLVPFGVVAAYDVAPDGSQFVAMVWDEASASELEIHVVLNWYQELERLVPAGQ